MKNLIYALTICLLVTACEKNETLPVSQDLTGKRALSQSEIILKNNLDQTAKIIAEIAQDQSVINELALLYEETRTFYSLSFKELLDESKSIAGSFRNLREQFLKSCSSTDTKGGWNDLAEFLSGNDCYIYCPYPSNFYAKGTSSFTVAAHPIDNDRENTGYRFEGRKMVEVKVDEEYADDYPVILIMPRDEDNDDLKGYKAPPAENSKGDPVYEIKVGKVRCANYCGGLFEGTLELRITRGYPAYNPVTEELGSAFTTAIPINYPRDYAKAAINNWTVHSNGGWYSVFIPWDTNWNLTKVQQCILVYEYDQVKEVSIGANVGYKIDDLSTTLTVSAKTTYRGDFLGLSEWDRNWFFATNTNPGIYDEVKDGWVVRKTSTVFKLTTPSRIIYY
jgi:hypothetical protein